MVRFVRERDDLAQAAAALNVLKAVPKERLFLLNVTRDADLLEVDRTKPAPPFADADDPARYRDWADAACSPYVSEIKAERKFDALPPALQNPIWRFMSRNSWGVQWWLNQVWIDAADPATDLDDGLGGRVAILASDAAELFGFGSEVAQAPRARRPTMESLRLDYPPDGGSWPHVPDDQWTPAQCAAMFRMRWIGGASEDMIAAAVGTEYRQRIYQLIGPARDWRRLFKDDWSGWKPSADLLRECGLAQEPEAVANSVR